MNFFVTGQEKADLLLQESKNKNKIVLSLIYHSI
jgi:hypothetical protein